MPGRDALKIQPLFNLEIMSDTPQLPAPDDDIRRDYLQLVEEIDRRVRELTEGRLAARITCRPGCADCCMAFAVLPLEAAFLAEALAGDQMQQPLAAGQGQGDDRCGLLRDGLCRLYRLRPVICRTQGMALAYVDEERQAIEVSACPRNFPEDAPLDRDDLLFMDRFNERLAALNLRYCRQHGLQPAVRIAIRDLLPRS